MHTGCCENKCDINREEHYVKKTKDSCNCLTIGVQ